MHETLLNKIYILKEMLSNDPRINELNLAEKDMESDEEVMFLSYQKDLALNEYNNDIKSFGEDSEITKNSKQKFIEAKDKLFLHPKVKKYHEKYQVVRILYFSLNKILFGKFSAKHCSNGENLCE